MMGSSCTFVRIPIGAYTLAGLFEVFPHSDPIAKPTGVELTSRRHCFRSFGLRIERADKPQEFRQLHGSSTMPIPAPPFLSGSNSVPHRGSDTACRPRKELPDGGTL
jgi:hypothetical protein